MYLCLHLFFISLRAFSFSLPYAHFAYIYIYNISLTLFLAIMLSSSFLCTAPMVSLLSDTCPFAPLLLKLGSLSATSVCLKLCSMPAQTPHKLTHQVSKADCCGKGGRDRHLATYIRLARPNSHPQRKRAWPRSRFGNLGCTCENRSL